MRLLWARVGVPHCPECGERIQRQTVQQIADQLMELPERTRYQIVAPTTWNFSPRDASGAPGPLERALVGVDGGEGSVAVQHVVRSFDPCMVCTVH